MIVGVAKETFPGERRVALVPSAVAALKRGDMEAVIEAGAGASAGFPDDQYVEVGARILNDRAEVFSAADVLCQVRTIGANPEHGVADLDLLRSSGDLWVIGLAEPLSDLDPIKALAETGQSSFALELIPRITRAQSMDVLSSQATIAGYKAVLLAATTLPKMMPMMMTAAGTIAAARVLVLGAGVAGLQAIATSRRNGAIVFGYDIRPAVAEQVRSLGAKFLELELEAGEAEDKGGYAAAMDEEFIRRQQEMMTAAVADSDVVITTAAVPGRKSPVLVTAKMVEGMGPGSVIIDLAAERGGNCELTRADETVVAHDVTILGPTNLPATVPFHASQMFSKNVTTLIQHVFKKGLDEVDFDDEITAGTLLTRGGEVANQRVREVFGLASNDADASMKMEQAADG